MATLYPCPEAGNQSASKLIPLQFVSSMFPSRCSSQSDSSTGDQSMVCVNCFQAKGDFQKALCQNPSCYFYLQSSNTDKSIAARRNASSSELSYDSWWPSVTKPVEPQTTSGLVTGPSHSESIWAYPINSYSTGLGLTRAKQRSQSICFDSVANRSSAKGDHGFRSRLLSLPVSEFYEPVETTDLVEDAFVPSAFAKEEYKPQRLTPDTDIDSGIGSPYGVHPEWSNEQSKPGAAISQPEQHFDMGLLKLELDATLNYKQPLLSSDDQSSSSQYHLRKFLLAGQFTALLNSKESTYSRKVFVGGLPSDIDEEDIKSIFLPFGPLTVNWPHKSHSKASIPPKGYAFLLFQEELSVQKLLCTCISEDNKFFIFIRTSTMAQKKVQVRPWYVADSLHYGDQTALLDPRKAVFVGGVPRQLKASELAQVMKEKYGDVILVAIDCDSELGYPKGAACVVFASHSSYIAAVSARFIQLNYASMSKKIEIKPYVLEDQLCDECHGINSRGKPAPFFCASVTCLQYYCESCWATIHSLPGRQNHRPLQKDMGEKRYY